MFTERDRGIQVYDRLYGQFEMPREVRALLGTPEFARLHHVSLNAVPDWFLPTGTTASKAEHSIGVSHLADILTKKPEFFRERTNLIFAAALHDVATPPFSHSTDHFVEEMLGVNHEGWAKEIITASQAVSRVIRDFGGDPNIVGRLIAGEEKPLSDLIAGTIDLDNLDNTPRYGVSMGLFLDPHYDPEQLVDFFGMKDGRVILNGLPAGFAGWERCRGEIYQFVYSETNLAPGMMLYRAVELLHTDGLLPQDFLRMTDEEALEFIRQKQHFGSFSLVSDALAWRFYPMVFDYETRNGKPILGKGSLLINWKMRSSFADLIAKEFNFRRHEVTVYAGSDKGYRQIHLPFVSDVGERYYKPGEAQTHMVKVFVHPKYAEQGDKISAFCQELLNSSEFSVPEQGRSPQTTGY